MLERLSFHSVGSHDFGSLHLFNLLTEAQIRNQSLDITGHLLYLNGRFTQCIEGPARNIELLWQSILRDSRHHAIELLNRQTTEKRRFTHWSMAFSTYATLYVHGMKGFFPVDAQGTSPLTTLCMTTED